MRAGITEWDVELAKAIQKHQPRAKKKKSKAYAKSAVGSQRRRAQRPQEPRPAPGRPTILIYNSQLYTLIGVSRVNVNTSYPGCHF